jgi:two-component system, OmpR family, response regulator
MRQYRKTILVVEDHPPQEAAIRRVVAGMGLKMIAAGDGAAAREILDGVVPDLICLELLLPDTSGYELCEFVRSSAAHCNVPVLVLSDRAYPADRAHADEVGADAFLVKPWLEDQLRARIELLLEQRGGGRARAVGESWP